MEHKRLIYEMEKDLFDRLVALAALILVAPLMIIISLIIVLDSPGGPIFPQVRVGKEHRRFTIYKFRTMKVKSDDREYKVYVKNLVTAGSHYAVDSHGPVYKLTNDKRVTRFGGLLRRIDLDELPQLINILKGDLSLVGPRPDIPQSVELYKAWHLQRLTVKPGLTGPWQINGRDRVSFDDMVSMDLDYIRQRNIKLDLKVLALTLPSIIKRLIKRREV